MKLLYLDLTDGEAVHRGLNANLAEPYLGLWTMTPEGGPRHRLFGIVELVDDVVWEDVIDTALVGSQALSPQRMFISVHLRVVNKYPVGIDRAWASW